MQLTQHDPIMNSEELKKKVGVAAADFITDGMIVGLGTGSTVFYFIERLIVRCNNGLIIKAVSSSEKSAQLAQKGNIPIMDINAVDKIDITVDGADEIDPDKRLIKGAGGAFFREKILASSSTEMVVIADESKLVSRLGHRPLPVELTPYASSLVIKRINDQGYHGHIRANPNGSKYFTDSGNLIYDIQFTELRNYPEKDHENLIHIAGVVETGFFFNLSGRIVIGYANGQVEIRE